ncbi:MAG: hypothetical protein GXX85_07730 [Ignavibacteria bacterium]|nr:hypothetical protein [Ignavibacteria bacterium]
MKTTSILAELLVIGTVSLGWIKPIIDGLIKYEVFKNEFSDYYIYYLIVVIYLLGIVLNYISDRFFYYYDARQVNKYGNKQKIQLLRCKLLLLSAEVNSYMSQKRSIIRIFRASAFNFLMYAVVALCSLYEPYLKANCFVLFLMSLCLSIIFFLGYHHTLNGYFKYITVMGDLINERTN